MPEQAISAADDQLLRGKHEATSTTTQPGWQQLGACPVHCASPEPDQLPVQGLMHAWHSRGPTA